MGKIKDLAGQRFGRLVVVEYKDCKSKSARWLCVCDCGKETLVSRCDLLNGSTKSCGCLLVEKCSKQLEKIRPITSKWHKENNWKEGTGLSRLTAKTPNNNTSGVKGVAWDKNRGLWIATIGFKSRLIYIGRYETIEEASKARQKAEKIYFTPILEKYGHVETS